MKITILSNTITYIINSCKHCATNEISETHKLKLLVISPQSLKDILADVWGQEEEIRTDTREWVFAFSLMAYQPLSDAELRAYVDLSATQAGRALNQALFDGFDRMYADIAYGLGLAAAQALEGEDL